MGWHILETYCSISCNDNYIGAYMYVSSKHISLEKKLKKLITKSILTKM